MFTKTGKEENYTNWWIDRQKVCRDETIVIENIPLFVAQGVFSPKIENTNSVGLLLRTFPDVRGKRVLEIGTGTGVLAIQAARSGAKEVIATDIIPVAIENAAKNFKSTNTDKVISLINEDRFENLSGRFDIIIMNIIFASSPQDMAAKEKIKVESLSLHKRLIAALPRILSQNGKVVLGFASFGDIDTLDTILRNPTLKVAVVSENKFDVNWYKIDVELKLADNK